MKVIRVFPRRTKLTPRDDYAFVGWPPSELIRPEADEAHVSVAFSWDVKRAWELYEAWRQLYNVVRIGGPAFNDPGKVCYPGQYIKLGVVFTSRGCNNQCPWCLVPKREGKLREIAFFPGNIINDNNLLQCSRQHLDRVFAMLKGQHGIEFAGGLDARLITDTIADDLRGLRIKQLFLACDTKESINSLRKAMNKLQGFKRRQLRCYVLIAHNGETISEATARLEEVWASGCLPFVQLYQPAEKYIKYSHEWKALAREWSRPAAMFANHKAFERG